MSDQFPTTDSRPDMIVRFWGTRGGLPVTGRDTIRHGGNTSCIELRCGQHLLILDAGSGLRPLGNALLQEDGPINVDLLISHTHLDHVMGLAYFAPLYRPGTELRLWGGHLPAGSLREALHSVLMPPLAPSLLEAARASLEVNAFTAGQPLLLRPELSAATAPLRHPGGATGYRIDWQGRRLAYVTDTEHEPASPDPRVLSLIRDADLMIYDCNYTDEEFENRRGWGHSTWQEAVRLAERGNVGRVVLFHHDAARSDTELDAIAAAASAVRLGTMAAFDGLELRL